MKSVRHQYIDRETFRVKTEKLYADKIVRFLYSRAREKPPVLFKALSSARMSSCLSFVNYDLFLGAKITGVKHFVRRLGVDLSECVDRPETFTTVRKLFERKIRYWETRPMPDEPGVVVSPADSKVLFGSFCENSHLFLKGTFFDFPELLGSHNTVWLDAFAGGDFAIFRLTPEKYHYNHTPVAGKVLDIYEIAGDYHSCNPAAVITIATPYSKNKRVVTIIDTDVVGGTHVGLVAMIEIVALMIGDIVQCYSEHEYHYPQPVTRGMFLRKGQPKSLYRPGSSTDILVFQQGAVRFFQDLITNMHRPGVQSRFTHALGRPLVETDIKVRSPIARMCR